MKISLSVIPWVWGSGLKKLGARSYRAPNVHLSIQYGARIFVHL